MKSKNEDFSRAQQEMKKPAMEVMGHIYKAFLSIPEFKLGDGSRAKVTSYITPEIDEKDGEVQCGFDVEIENGSHWEFMVKNTGWGKPFANNIVRKPGREGQQR